MPLYIPIVSIIWVIYVPAEYNRDINSRMVEYNDKNRAEFTYLFLKDIE